MHEDVRIVEHDPAAGVISLLSPQVEADLLRLFLQIVTERFDLRHRAAAADDEPVGDHGSVADMNGEDILRLFVIQRCTERFHLFR